MRDIAIAAVAGLSTATCAYADLIVPIAQSGSVTARTSPFGSSTITNSYTVPVSGSFDSGSISAAVTRPPGWQLGSSARLAATVTATSITASASGDAVANWADGGSAAASANYVLEFTLTAPAEVAVIISRSGGSLQLIRDDVSLLTAPAVLGGNFDLSLTTGRYQLLLGAGGQGSTQGGGGSGPAFGSSVGISMTFVPSPSAATLLIVGGVAATRRRRDTR